MRRDGAVPVAMSSPVSYAKTAALLRSLMSEAMTTASPAGFPQLIAAVEATTCTVPPRPPDASCDESPITTRVWPATVPAEPLFSVSRISSKSAGSYTSTGTATERNWIPTSAGSTLSEMTTRTLPLASDELTDSSA